MVGLYFAELFDNSGVIDGKTAKLAKALCGLVVFVHLDEVSGSLWQEEKSKNKRQSL